MSKDARFMRPVACIYCKALMKSEVFPSKRHDGLFAGHFLCGNCSAQSPIAWSYSKEDAESRARYLASELVPQKYEREENRVLTYDELMIFNSVGRAVPCEIKGELLEVAWIANVLVPVEEVVEDEETLKLCRAGMKPDVMSIKHNLPKPNNYGRTWRCWFKPPTHREMQETPWEES